MNTHMLLGGVLMTQVVAASNLDNILNIALDSIKGTRGNVMYRLCADKECHDNENSNAYRQGVIKAKSGKMRIVIDNLPAGDYSFTVFHDRNANEKLDTNLIGAPKEPFGFSKLSTMPFSKPSWSSTKFRIKSNTSLTVKMFKLF
jgi:uncharacterized protein (DUF2141 family)